MLHPYPHKAIPRQDPACRALEKVHEEKEGEGFGIGKADVAGIALEVRHLDPFLVALGIDVCLRCWNQPLGSEGTV